MNRPNTSQGIPLDKKQIYKQLINFMDDALFTFVPFSKDAKGNNVISEDLITRDLEKVLNNKSREKNEFFAFQNQHKEGRYSTDISVYRINSYKEFCWIEAKRLPTPDAGKERDEREYIIVSQEKENGKKKFKGSGGIQRFKEGKHAPGLSCSIIIGYIQENDAKYWMEKINGWIRRLITEMPLLWNETDCLKKQKNTKCDKYLSVHNRTNDLTPITLHHFWIKLPING